jgi:catechol 2,3-dioxygenase-like lactoylglutathione lyase family enzyme
MAKQYDRSAEDLGNVVGLEHVNVLVPDQGLATLFYVSGLGLTRDPYLMTSVDNMWINVGKSQFHLPTGKAQVLRGRTAMVIPGRDLLVKRLENMKKPLDGTKFAFSEHDDHVTAICPWGNEYVLYEPSKAFAGMVLGMPYIEFDVPQGTADGIAAFYRDVICTMAFVKDGAAHASVGYGQELIFRETDKPLAPYDGHHIQVYVANFSKPHKELVDRKILTEESNQYQYRFNDIIDPKTGRKLFEIEHEIRSITHPLYARPLVNRNPRQSNRNYVHGRDAWVPEWEDADMGDPRRAMREARYQEVTGRALAAD